MIEKSTKDVKELTNTILNPEDFRASSEALRELMKIDPERAKVAAKAIIDNGEEEVHYRAFAFHMFYSLSRNKALEYVCEHAVTSDTYLLYAMLDEAAYDRLHNSPDENLKNAVGALKRSLNGRARIDLEAIGDSLREFEDTYAARKS